MKLSNAIIKNLNRTKDALCDVLLGSIVDEENVKYSIVYKYEISGLLERLECDLDTLLKIDGAAINSDVLANLIVVNEGFSCEEYNFLKLKKYCEDIFDTANREIWTELIKKENLEKHGESRLTKEEDDFIKKLLRDEQKNKRRHLAELSCNENSEWTKFMSYFKENDIEKYNSILKNMVSEYIISSNLLYKLYGEQPKDWNTGLSLHNSICTIYKIDRNSFLF